MKKIYKTLKPFLLFIFVYTSLSVFVVVFFKIVNPSATAFINSKFDSIPSLFKAGDFHQKYLSVKKISKYAALAAIASEDQLFFEHFGFDFEQIEKAMKENERRKRIRGASTISMQVAKNMFLWSGKNILRKGFEAYYTLLLEVIWGKERIMDVYLNYAEMGIGIYGIEAASRIYYKKSSSNLNATEAATIIAILPNPTKRDPRKPTSYLINRRDRILKQMNLIGGTEILKDYIDY